jgi:hypothetical protein
MRVNPFTGLDVGGGAANRETVFDDRVPVRNSSERDFMSGWYFGYCFARGIERKDIARREWVDGDGNIVVRMNPHYAMLSSNNHGLLALYADCHAAGSV